MATAAPSSTASIAVDRSDESSTTALYRAAVGNVNAHYYQLHFGRFEAADRAGASWNWAACLCTLNWMVFRQLWSAALVYAGALVGGALLLFGIGRLVFQFSQETEWGLLAAFVAALLLVPGLYGNAIFHAHCRKRMAAALAANTTLPEAVAMLNRQASTRQRLIWLMLANAVVVGLAVAAYLAFQQAGALPGDALKTDARNVAVGRTTDAASGPVASASAPVAAASAPAVAASAPAKAAVTPAPAASAASGLVAPAAAASAAAPMPAKAASAAALPAMAASAPKPAASAAPIAEPVNKPAAPAKGVEPVAKPAAATKATAPAKASKPSKADTAAATPAKPAPTTPHYFINVGLFAQEANARSAHTKLLDAGLVAFTQDIKTPKGKMTRVRVGPFDNQRDADAAVERIRALGLDAILFQQ